jgi:AraC-like DNA-binding protein
MAHAATPPLVLALVHDMVGRIRLQSAFGDDARVRFCSAVEQFLQLAAAEQPELAIVEPRDDAGNPTAPVIATLRRGRPKLRVLAYCRLQPDDCHELPALGRAGASAVVFRDIDDKGPALRDVLDEAHDSTCAAEFIERLQRASPPVARGIVTYCARHASPRLPVERVAFAFGITRRTLANRFTRAGLPPPSTIITWCRLLQAACAMRDPTVSMKQIARAHGFGDPTTLRRVLFRHTGLRITELRERNPVEAILDAILDQTTFAGLRRSA